MTRRSVLRLAPVGMAIVLSASTMGSSALASHAWSTYHWGRTANPFTLKLGNNLTTADWTSHLNQTSSDWNKSTVLQTALVAGQTTSKRCRAVVGVDQICNGTYGNNGWLGVAQIWTSGSHITQGTVKVNDTYFNQAAYNYSTEREHVMCQEVGHTFGLDHQSTSGTSLNTCMDYYNNTSDTDTKSTTPNQHDYDELVTIYSHLDSSNTIGAIVSGQPGNAAGVGLGDSSWGQLVASSANGRSATFVRDLGAGQKVITFVDYAR